MPIQTLSINADDLLAALRERNPQISSWLDRETGEIYQISALFGDDEAEDDPAFTAAMRDHPERFLQLPVLPAAVGFQAMRAFTEGLSERGLQIAPALQKALQQALTRQRAFFHFQDVLATVPETQARWRSLIRQQMLAWADSWLMGQGIRRDS